MARTKRASYRRFSRSPMRRAQAARSSGADTLHTPCTYSRAVSPISPASLSTTFPPSEKPTRNAGARPSLRNPQHRQKVAGQAGVIKRAAEVFRAAAGAHVKTMRRETRAQGRRTQAPYVAGVPSPLQAVHHDDLAPRLAVRTLGAHQDLHVGLRAVQAAFHRKLRRQIRTLPEVRGDGLQVRAAEQRVKGSHGGSTL